MGTAKGRNPLWTKARETAAKDWKHDPEWLAQRTIRRGLPAGMDQKTFRFFQRQARFEATMTMKKLDAAGVTVDCDEYAREALTTALEQMRLPIHPKEKLAAARLVLDFTKAKPAQKQEITVTKAEEWLEAVTADNGKGTDEGSTSGA